MTSYKNIIETRDSVNTFLDNCQVLGAIDKVKEMLEESGMSSEFSKVDKILETYRYLFHYLIEGARDDNRNVMIADLSEQLAMIADKCVRRIKAKDSNEYYYSVLRFADFRNESLSDILKEYGNVMSELSLADAAGNDVYDMRKRKEALLERLFNSLFTSLGDDSAYSQLKDYILSGYADESVVALSLSAITLSLMCFYDRAKMHALIDIYENSDDNKMSARALVGILFSLITNSLRIERDEKLKARLYLWNDSIESYRRLRDTIRIIVGTRDTERITNKMKDEVIPELMKLRPEIMNKLREGSLSDIDPAEMTDNPEWEEILDKSGLNKRMQELSDMQSEGADLLMVTFSNLKQFPFFNSASNWFLPFDPDHTSLNLDDNMRKFVLMLSSSGGNMCDSDLYSLALASAHMPQAQKDMISGQMTAQFEQLREEMKSRNLKSSSPEFDLEVQKVVRDLYRFFKLFRKKEGFVDPFAKPLQFTEMPVVGEMMKDEDVLELIGEFYFKRGYYKDALPLLLTLSETRTDDATLWEKLGFCYQSEKLYTHAAEAYNKAALLKTPGPWLIHKLANVYRRLGDFEKASEYYEKALEMDPDNIKLLMSTGNVLLESGNLIGALQHFYHANYMSPDTPAVLRAIAWVELLNGNFSKSGDYYSKVIMLKPQASDYLNAGHSALLRNLYKEALNYYRLSSEERPEDFRLAFLADLDTLESLGLDRKIGLLLLDATLNKK